MRVFKVPFVSLLEDRELLSLGWRGSWVWVPLVLVLLCPLFDSSAFGFTSLPAVGDNECSRYKIDSSWERINFPGVDVDFYFEKVLKEKYRWFPEIFEDSVRKVLGWFEKNVGPFPEVVPKKKYRILAFGESGKLIEGIKTGCFKNGGDVFLRGICFNETKDIVLLLFGGPWEKRDVVVSTTYWATYSLLKTYFAPCPFWVKAGLSSFLAGISSPGGDEKKGKKTFRSRTSGVFKGRRLAIPLEKLFSFWGDRGFDLVPRKKVVESNEKAQAFLHGIKGGNVEGGLPPFPDFSWLFLAENESWVVFNYIMKGKDETALDL